MITSEKHGSYIQSPNILSDKLQSETHLRNLWLTDATERESMAIELSVRRAEPEALAKTHNGPLQVGNSFR